MLNSNKADIYKIQSIRATINTGSTYGDFKIYFTKAFSSKPCISCIAKTARRLGFVINNFITNSSNEYVGVTLQAYNSDKNAWEAGTTNLEVFVIACN